MPVIELSWTIYSFEYAQISLLAGPAAKSLPREIKPPERNLSLVLKNLICLSNEPVTLSLVKYLAWKICYLLALASAKRISELHGLSYQVRHLKGWKPCTFSFVPDFIAKSQNLSILDPRFEKLIIPLLTDFMGGDRDMMLLCTCFVLRSTLAQLTISSCLY